MRRTRTVIVILMATVLLLPVIPVSTGTTRQPLDSVLSDAVARTVPADDYHSNHNFVVSTLSHHWISWSLSQSNGIYGDFEVTDPASGADQIITFFICDQYNYNEWVAGRSASVYHLQENVGSYSFHWVVSSADTWYFVFKNYAILYTKTINFDLYRDLTPPAISMNLDAGATYSGIKEITAAVAESQFSIGSVELRIDGVSKKTESDSSFSYSWVTTGYSNGAHTVRITASDNVGNSGYEEVVVNVANAVTTTSTTPTTTTRSTTQEGVLSPSVIGIALAVVLSIAAAGGGGYAFLRKRPSKVAEQQIPAGAKVLVICPFCGAKTEQGVSHCQHCRAPL